MVWSTGWLRIAWILVAAVFVYDVSVETKQFEIIKQSIGGISSDRRLQVLLIAFAFGALLEGAGGGGAPVAVTGAMLIGLGFPPLETALLVLVANSAPVAFGGLGNPVRTLVAVTGLPEADFSAMIGRILGIIILILPFWLISILCKMREAMSIWPGLAVAAVTSAGLQFVWSNYLDASPGKHRLRARHANRAGHFFLESVASQRELAVRRRSTPAGGAPFR